MRAPAQHRHPAFGTAWAHPYTGTFGRLVCHADGGDPAPAPAPAPTPAELAAKLTAPAPAPAPKPGDDEEMVSLTQRRLNVIMRDEKEEGRRAAYRKIAEAAGLDPDSFDPSKFGEIFKQAEAARQAQLTEEQRRAEELAQREAALAEEKAKAERLLADAQRQARDVKIRAALVNLGATGDDLEDAARLLTVDDNATDEQIQQAAQQLKERRGVLFGGQVPQTLPPAPSGGPAPGGTPRPENGGKNAIDAAAKQRAIAMGLRAPDAA